MLKTSFDSGKPIYGIGSIAVMVKPLLNPTFYSGLCVVGVGGGGAGVRGGGWKGGVGRAECVGGVGVMLCFD